MSSHGFLLCPAAAWGAPNEDTEKIIPFDRERKKERKEEFYPLCLFVFLIEEIFCGYLVFPINVGVNLQETKHRCCIGDDIANFANSMVA